MISNRKKHILFLSSWYPSRILPDNGDFIQRHAKAASLCNRITVLHAIKDPNLQEKFERYEAKTNGETTEGNELREIIIYFRPSSFRPFNFLRKIQAYLIGLKEIETFDLVHLHVTYPAGIIALYLKFFKNKKYVITEHWTGFRAGAFAKLPIGERLAIKTILENASVILPVSDDLRKQLINIAPNVKSAIIPNVINTRVFSAKKQQKTAFQRKRFLHISNLQNEHKNISGMLNVALRLIQEGFDFEFHIGGNGDWQNIQRFIEQHNIGDKVFTFGRLQHTEVAEKMQTSDCFILFSNYENQPCVQIESFASGTAVIATKVGGIAEFFPENFGFLVDKGDENALYEAMKKVIEGKKFASQETMSQYAIQHFSQLEIAKQFDDVYNKVVA